jgi:hypothetical protein
MNRTGCVSPLATDEVFLYGDGSPGSCDAHLGVWAGLAVVTLLLKSLSAGVVLVLWLRRNKRKKAKRRRWPVVPAMVMMGLIVHVLFWSLVGLDILSKGYAAPLIGITAATFSIPFMIYCLKFVRLGLSASPELAKWKTIRGDESRLVQMDIAGGVLFSMAVTSLSGLCMGYIILAPIFADDPRPFLAAVALNGLTNVTLTLFIAMHIRRLRRAYVLGSRGLANERLTNPIL